MKRLLGRSWSFNVSFAISIALLASKALGQSEISDELFEHGEAPKHMATTRLDLVDQLGRPFSLHQLPPSGALVFFGFTRCASACPPALVQAQGLLNASAGRKMPAVIWVTLDPRNDTPSNLRSFLQAVDSRIVGLTGTGDQIEAAARQYGVNVQGEGLATNHSARWYLVTPKGQILRTYRTTDPVQAMSRDLVHWQRKAAAMAITARN